MIRIILKYYTRFKVRQYLAFCERHKSSQTNMNIARARLIKARIIYLQSLFEPWGDYFIGGKGEFSYGQKLGKKLEAEMIWMGFTRDIRDKEWTLLKNERYPATIDYYPHKQSREYKCPKGSVIKTVTFPLDYREIINEETNTFQNYKIPL